MDHRTKRAIKTPKRFEDAFTPPPKKEPAVEPAPKPTPETKSIIKVKLNRVKPKASSSTSSSSSSSTQPKISLPVQPKVAPPVTSKVAPPVTPKVAPPVQAKPPPPPPPPIVEKVQPPETPSFPRTKRTTMSRPKRPSSPPSFIDLIPNVVLPFWDARTAAEEHENDNVKELVHCNCGVTEELGLMVQCETCLTWQHAHCLGIENPEDAPERYTCGACLEPKYVRQSMKWAYDQDWLTQGRMKQFACDPNPLPEKNVRLLNKINELIGNVLTIHQIIHSLRVKNRILLNAQDDDPELKLFANQWSANYQHADGTLFVPTVNHSPASTISAIAETPDPNDITVDSLPHEVSLPDIGQLEDVSAILEGNLYMPDAPDPTSTPISNQNPIQPMINSNDATPNECRANLRLHIQQTEEYLGLELAQVEEQLTVLEKECRESDRKSSFWVSVDSLKNDLHTMRNYLSQSTGENIEN